MLDHIEIKDPLKEGDIKVKTEGHQMKEGTRIEDTLEEGTPIKMEGPLEEEVPLMEMEVSPSNLRYISIRKYLQHCGTIYVTAGQGPRPNQ